MDQRVNPVVLWCLVLCLLLAAADARLGVQETVAARAARLQRVVAAVIRVPGAGADVPPPVQVRVGAIPRGAQRSGWFDPKARELIVQEGVDASADDALFAMLQAELRDGLGGPASPWFERGVIYGLIGSCAGFSLTEIESRTGEVTLDEVLGLEGGRARVSMAPAEARLARSLLAATGQSVPALWQLPVVADSAVLPALRAAWHKSSERSPIEPRLAYPRSIREGAYVAHNLSASPVPDLESEFARLKSLGFAGIQLGVTIRADSSSGAPDPVTSEGDGVLIAVALRARAAGLSVVLAPRFLGPQPLDDAGAVEAIGVARGGAVEALAWLAEQGQVDGLILFGSKDLLQPESRGFSPELRAARRGFRRRVLARSRPFAGDRFAMAKDAATLASAMTEDFDAEFQGALAVIRLNLGRGTRVDSPAMHLEGLPAKR